MLELTDILVFSLIAVFLMLGWNAQGVKQIALSATKAHCKKMDVLLLDDGIALRGFWIKRNRAGKLCLWRSYDFEFTSTGDERYAGTIILLGRMVEDIQLQPHRLN